ncbi:MAG: hypothetical protein LBS53_05215 [Synergistaceae bacterium]|nr:hypothetical protein [Synergistaceae bacterium]
MARRMAHGMASLLGRATWRRQKDVDVAFQGADHDLRSLSCLSIPTPASIAGPLIAETISSARDEIFA